MLGKGETKTKSSNMSRCGHTDQARREGFRDRAVWTKAD